MGFYDNYNFDGMKLFSKINTDPCSHFLSILSAIKQLKTISPPPEHYSS